MRCARCGEPMQPRLVFGRRRMGRPQLYCGAECRREVEKARQGRATVQREDISAAEIERRFAAAKAAIQRRRRVA